MSFSVRLRFFRRYTFLTCDFFVWILSSLFKNKKLISATPEFEIVILIWFFFCFTFFVLFFFLSVIVQQLPKASDLSPPTAELLFGLQSRISVSSLSRSGRTFRKAPFSLLYTRAVPALQSVAVTIREIGDSSLLRGPRRWDWQRQYAYPKFDERRIKDKKFIDRRIPIFRWLGQNSLFRVSHGYALIRGFSTKSKEEKTFRHRHLVTEVFFFFFNFYITSASESYTFVLFLKNNFSRKIITFAYLTGQ